MPTFMTHLFACSISMSIISLIWIGLLPVLSRRYEAKWLYGICLLLTLSWMIPFRPAVDLSFLSAQFPVDTTIPIQPDQQNVGQVLPMLSAEGEMAGRSISTSSVFLWGIPAIWLAGVCVYLVIHGLRHWRLTQSMRRWSEPVTEASVLGIAKRLKEELNIRQSVELKAWSGVSSPMLMGLRKPVIVLPSADLADDELDLILKHELIHFQRRDLWHKAIVLLATALHWFNPVVYLMARATAAQCEISCDARVLRGADSRLRKQYGETIIGMARRQAAPRTGITTFLYGGKQGMKARLFSIMDTKKKKAGVLLLGIVLIAIIGAGAVFAAHAAETSTEKNQTFDEPVVHEIIGPIRVKQEIPVALDALQVNEFVPIGGPITIQEGDIIQFDLQGEGDGHLNVGFRKTADPGDDKSYLGYSGLTGNRVKNAGSYKVEKKFAGTYYLSVGNFDGKSLDPENSSGALRNIKGTVKLAVDEGDSRQQSEGQAGEIKGAPVEGGSISTRDGEHLSVSAFRSGEYTNFAELPFQQGETFTLSVISQEALDLEVGLLSISTDEEFGERVKSLTGEVSITIPEDGEYRIYLRNHATEPADFELHLSKAIEGPIV